MSTEYQVTLEWGVAGARAARGAVLVIADADGAEAATLRAEASGVDLVLDATLETAADAAAAVLTEQERRGERTIVAIVAAGASWPDGTLRPLAADALVAGAVVDALAELGIDFHSPACAVACAAAVGLRGATKALIAAEARA